MVISNLSRRGEDPQTAFTTYQVDRERVDSTKISKGISVVTFAKSLRKKKLKIIIWRKKGKGMRKINGVGKGMEGKGREGKGEGEEE